ncbi:MAG: endonuclease III [archaeon]
MEKSVKVMKVLLEKYKTHRKPTVRRSSNDSPFRVLISCLLSLRTQDKNTEKASGMLFEVADTPEKILKLRQDRLEKLIFSSGHYIKKARVLKSVSKDLIDRFDGKVPKTREELLSIKGVGPKTANIVLCFAYGQTVIPVDTHVHRIPNRLGLIKTKNPEESEVDLMRVFPKKYWKEINTTFILFGKEICLPVSPKCSECMFKACPRVGVLKSR